MLEKQKMVIFEMEKPLSNYEKKPPNYHCNHDSSQRLWFKQAFKALKDHNPQVGNNRKWFKINE
jgi:hypothetical protein